MAIQRAVLSGKIAGTVNTRNVFTADITIVAGDEPENYWTPYLQSITNNIVSMTASVWVADSYEVMIPAGGGWESVAIIPFSASGLVSGDYLPNAVAAVLLGKAAGKRHIGRKFFSAIPESVTTANSLVGVALTNAGLALAAYITPLTTVLGSVLTPGVVDKTGTFHAFTSGVVSSLLGSMRRRKPGLGI